MTNVKRVLVMAAAMLLISASFANAATVFYVSAKGVKQGQLKGDSTREAFKDKMEAIGFSLEVTSPRDAASGMATGRRQYKPLQITKPISAASPQFFQALATNEPLQTVTLEFVKTNPSGEEYIYYTIKLTNASVASIRQHAEPGDSAKQGGSPQQLEDVSFSFQKIEISSADGKTMAVDDWSTQK